MPECFDFISVASENQINLFDINWDDVLIPKIVCYLSLKDIFNLRCCSTLSQEFAENSLKFIKEIDLSGNNSQHIELAFAVLARYCQRLKRIYLAKCTWLRDGLLMQLLDKNASRLEVVNLNECMNITPVALQPIIIKCKELRVLKLSKCQWVTTGAVDALTLHQNNIEEFDISYCASIGERCLLIFFRKLNKLKVLSLSCTPSVTDNVLAQIGNYCRALEHINLVGCLAITDYGLTAIANNCEKLKSVFVQRCPGVTERVLAPLRIRVYVDRRPQINYLRLQV